MSGYLPEPAPYLVPISWLSLPSLRRHAKFVPSNLLCFVPQEAILTLSPSSPHRDSVRSPALTMSQCPVAALLRTPPLTRDSGGPQLAIATEHTDARSSSESGTSRRDQREKIEV
jgi:hypothetical protein